MENPIYGKFGNGIPFVRLVGGDRTILLFSGGPGNSLPSEFVLRTTTKGLAPLLEDYTVYILTRKSGLPEGYSTTDMSNDYADLIHQEFEGHVDLVIGMSYGGLIAQHFAADHSELCDHIVIIMAAHKISSEGRELDRRYAALLSEGKDRAAYVLIATLAIPEGFAKTVFKAIFWLLAGFLRGSRSGTFRSDVLVEVQAELDHDASEKFSKVEKPILILCGDQDRYFPIEFVEEFGKLIPRSKVIFYEGRGHDIIADPRFAKDVQDWVDKKLDSGQNN